MQTLYFKLFIASGELKISILESYKKSGEYNLFTSLLILGMMLQILIYILASLLEFKKYHKRYEANFSNNQLGQLNMFRAIYKFFLFYFLLEFTLSTILNFTAYESSFLSNWSLVVWTFFIYGIGYIAILDPTFLLPPLPIQSDQKELETNKNGSIELERIIDYVKSEKAFKRADLSLPELADKIGISTNRASFLINRVHGVNFYDFINTYRVKEVKRMLESGKYKQMSIIGISQEAGFRSKASFYKFFKREFCKTPTQFIAQLEGDNA